MPTLSRQAKSRETVVYRGAAEDLLSNPDSATYLGPREKGWRQASKLKSDTGEAVPWGYVKNTGYTLVWIAENTSTVRAVRLAPSAEYELEQIIYLGAIVVNLAILLMTFFGLRFFILSAKAKDTFLMAAAHDLTSPLAAMRELITLDATEAKRINERMLIIVNNLKAFIRGGKRTAIVKRECFSMVSAVKEAYTVFAEDFKDEVSGPVVIDFDTDGYVFADRTLTIQILWNLLGNALKYAAPYGPVKLRLYSDSKYVYLSLRDWGPGMTSRQMRRVFDRYYRSKTALESGKGGFGFGLCSAKEFAVMMNGDLIVEANLPHGTAFILTLPIDIHTKKYV